MTPRQEKYTSIMVMLFGVLWVGIFLKLYQGMGLPLYRVLAAISPGAVLLFIGVMLALMSGTKFYTVLAKYPQESTIILMILFWLSISIFFLGILWPYGWIVLPAFAYIGVFFPKEKEPPIEIGEKRPEDKYIIKENILREFGYVNCIVITAWIIAGIYLHPQVEAFFLSLVNGR